MSITLDIPPAMAQEVKFYADAGGSTLNDVIIEFIHNEIARRLERRAAARRFRDLAASIAARLKGGAPYKFNRADAYEDSPSGARNYDFP